MNKNKNGGAGGNRPNTKQEEKGARMEEEGYEEEDFIAEEPSGEGASMAI